MPDMSQVRVEEDYRNLTIEIEGKRIIKQPNPPLKRLPCADLDYLTCTDRFYDPPCEKVEYSIKMDAIETRWQSQSACQQLGVYGKCVAISFSSQKLETIDTKLIYD